MTHYSTARLVSSTNCSNKGRKFLAVNARAVLLHIEAGTRFDLLAGRRKRPGQRLSLSTRSMILAEMTEALARGWGGRDSRSVMLLQQERAGVDQAMLRRPTAIKRHR
jgi:hypothetical protein